MPTELSQMQDDIINRFKRPLRTEPWTDEQLQNAQDATVLRRGQVPVNQPPQMPAQPSPWHPPMVEGTNVPPPVQTSGSPYLPQAAQQINAPVPAQQAKPDPNPPAVIPLTNPKTGQPIRSAHQELNPNDRLKAESEYRDALDAWKPHGGRGFKQVLKEGLIGGAAAAQANPNNPYAALTGFGVGAASGVAQPGVITRNWELNKANQDIGRRLNEQHARNTVDNSGMVPVQLNDGRMVMVQRAKAADIASRQQTVDQGQQRINETAIQNKAHRDRWETMDAHTAKADVVKQWNSGMLTDPRDREAAARVLGIQGPLREKFIRGEVRDGLDENGNFIEINRNTGAITNTNQGSYATTQEAGKDRRAAAQIGAANTRAANRLGSRGGMSTAAQARADRLVKQYNDARSAEINYNASRGKDAPVDNATKAQLQSKRENLQRQVYDTYPGIFEEDQTGRIKRKAESQGSSSAKAPAQDGAFHYSQDEIKAHAAKIGQSVEYVMEQLKKQPNVVID